MEHSRARRRIAAGAVLAIVVAGALLTSPETVFSRAAWLVADPVRLLVAAVGFAIVRPVLAWPTTLLAVLLGYGFGFAGFPVALALVTLTSLPPFLLANRLGADGEVASAGAAVVDRAGDVLDRLRDERAIEAKGGGSGEPVQAVFDLGAGEFRVGDGGKGPTNEAEGGRDEPTGTSVEPIDPSVADVIEEIRSSELAETSPLELMNRVREWQRRLEDESS